MTTKEERAMTKTVRLSLIIGVRDNGRLWDPLYEGAPGARTKIEGDLQRLIEVATDVVYELEAQMIRWPPQTDEQKKNHGDRLERARAIRDTAIAFQRLQRNGRGRDERMERAREIGEKLLRSSD